MLLNAMAPRSQTHRFAMWKFDDLANHLVKRGQVVQSFSDFVRPEPAREDEVLLVHDNQYYRDFVGGTLSTDLMRRTGDALCCNDRIFFYYCFIY